MEQMLLKMARQLDAMDDASLMSLWEKYARQVKRFEPSQRWQEAALVLSLIQAKRWKNLLFNAQWIARVRADQPVPPPDPAFTLEEPQSAPTHRATVLAFHPLKKTDAD